MTPLVHVLLDGPSLDTADGPMHAFRTAPDGDGRGPALLIIQEAFGVNPHIRNVCRRVTEHGYVALAPELFHRTGERLEFGYTDMSVIYPHFGKLTNQGILMDLQAGLAALRADPGAGAGCAGRSAIRPRALRCARCRRARKWRTAPTRSRCPVRSLIRVRPHRAAPCNGRA